MLRGFAIRGVYSFGQIPPSARRKILRNHPDKPHLNLGGLQQYAWGIPKKKNRAGYGEEEKARNPQPCWETLQIYTVLTEKCSYFDRIYKNWANNSSGAGKIRQKQKIPITHKRTGPRNAEGEEKAKYPQPC